MEKPHWYEKIWLWMVAIAAMLILITAAAAVLLLSKVDHGYTTERVFESRGITLRGTLYSSRTEQPKGFLLLAHGNRAQGRQHPLYSQVARLLSTEFVVFVFDFNGYGDSEDPRDNTYAGIDFSQDVIHAAQYLSRTFQIPEDQVVLVGHSLGSLQVLRAAKTLKTKTIVAIGAGNKFKEILESEENRTAYARKILRNTGSNIDQTILAESGTPLLLDNLLSGCPEGRLLLVYGENETQYRTDAEKYVNAIQNSCSSAGSVEIATVPDTDHMYGTEAKNPWGWFSNLVGSNYALRRLAETVTGWIDRTRVTRS